MIPVGTPTGLKLLLTNLVDFNVLYLKVPLGSAASLVEEPFGGYTSELAVYNPHSFSFLTEVKISPTE